MALQVFRDGARQIAHLLTTCANNLGMGEQGYRIASSKSGSVTGSNFRYFNMIREELLHVHPKAELVLPQFDPVIGAGLIALDEIGVAWNPRPRTAYRAEPARVSAAP